MFALAMPTQPQSHDLSALETPSTKARRNGSEICGGQRHNPRTPRLRTPGQVEQAGLTTQR
jgi:hypothetical protein